ncbi:MAG: nitric oxide reductase [Bdellovibrionales bacterium GWB1_55_8]|nr:MAG: nitric oxide reductase [Bdellovibrionales bacterium GWB1_55_8]
MTKSEKRGMLISKRWLHASLFVFLIGFFVLGFLAFRTYGHAPPIPVSVVDSSGSVVFTGRDIQDGQRIFLRSGLMEYGSVFGHGAYLGPDFTADYLRRAAEFVADANGGKDKPEARFRTAREFKENRYDSQTGILTLTTTQTAAHARMLEHYREYFSDAAATKGLQPGILSNAEDLRKVTAFFGWAAWASAALRPGKDYSYTNNWPPEPLVENRPTADMVFWSVLSLIALLGGIGLLLASFGKWNFLGWHGRESLILSFRRPGDVALTPAQRACAWFMLVMAALFLLQTLVGGATQHYRAEISGFFGLNLAQYIPFNLARTWHIQLAIFWVSTSFLAAGIFLAPMISGREPKGQAVLSYLLLGALAVVVFGSMAGEMLGIHGITTSLWFGNQGMEYLDLGRFWQLLLSIGLFFWVVIVFRSLRARLPSDHIGNMPWLFFFSALAIPSFYAVGLLSHPDSSFTVNDFWRFWVVHLWVEDFLELFTTVAVAYIFVLLGVVTEKIALRVVYLDIILYSIGGVVGTMHHLYFSGEPVEHMALGAFFSAAEVIPLTFLTVEAWSFVRLGLHQQAKSAAPFPHRWSVMFLVAVGFWNFLGAGIFGFLINLPIVSYFQIGTALTANHGHAAMMGVYGMLAAGLALFILRYLMPDDRWSDRAAKISFWSLNLGLAWMVFATLFPIGLVQLYHSVRAGYFEARQIDFLTTDTLRLIEWLRLPGDAVFIIGGVLPLLWLCWRGVRYRVKPAPADITHQPLFTEVSGTSENRGLE